jgi:putative resolvase
MLISARPRLKPRPERRSGAAEELYCARQGWTFEVIADLGSGMDYHKKGLKRLLNMILADEVGRLVITHKDRQPRRRHEFQGRPCQGRAGDHHGL